MSTFNGPLVSLILSVAHMSYSQFFQIISGHGFLVKDYISGYNKLQEGPLCPRLRVLISLMLTVAQKMFLTTRVSAAILGVYRDRHEFMARARRISRDDFEQPVGNKL